MNKFNEVLKTNREREQLKRQILRVRKEQKKETIITILISLFIIITTIMLLNNMKTNDNALNKCITEGHSQNYCVRTV